MIAALHISVTVVLAAAIFGVAPANAASLDEARDLHRQGEFDAALEAYARVTQSDATPADRATAHNNACVIHTNRGRLADAAAQCEQALALRRSLNDAHRIARTLNNVARVQERLGNVDEARANHVEALAIHQRNADGQNQVISLLNLGVLETNARRYADALARYASADVLIRAAGDASWAPGQRILSTLNTGVVLEQIGAYREALTKLDAALSEATSDAPWLLPDLYLNRGVVLRNLGDPVAALDAYRLAQREFEQRDDPPAIASAYLNQALVLWLDQNRIDDALTLLQRARDISHGTGDATLVGEARYFSIRALLDHGKPDQAQRLANATGANVLDHDAQARITFATGKLEAALMAARSALALFEQQRDGLTQNTYRQRILSDRRAAYALTIDILYALYERDQNPAHAREAQRVAGRAKALALIEATGRAEANTEPAHVTPQVNDLWLEVFDTTNHLYAWAITEQSISWRRHDAAAMRRAAQSLHQALSHGDIPPDTALRQLGILLEELDPAAPTLTVSPDGALGAVPFELILAHRTGTVLAPTAVRYAASHTLTPPSANVPDSSAKPPTLLAFAREQPRQGALDHPALRALAPLRFAREEITRAQRFFAAGSRLHMANDASETTLRALRPEPHDVLHIASHAVLDGRLDDGTVLILAGDQTHDGLLFPRDVAALALPVALTVLSGCNTALGTGTTGSPVTNLTGAFMAAGSRSVLATLWPVDDEASAVMMEQFYAQLERGLPTDRALHEAKRRMATSDDWAAPSYWAGYLLYGNSDPLVATKSRPPLWAIGLAGLLALALIRVRSRRTG